MTAGYLEHHSTYCPSVVQQATWSHIPHIVHQDHSEFLHITFINIPADKTLKLHATGFSGLMAMDLTKSVFYLQ